MNNYLAKSNPRESIIEHTEKLIKNYEILKGIYPNLKVDWDILYMACLYHDLGKMNRKFQDKIEGIESHDDEIPHGILSLAFIDYEKLEGQGYSDEDIKMLFHAIGYHHERELKYTEDQLEDEIGLMALEYENFEYSRLENLELQEFIEDSFFFKNYRISEDEDIFLEYTMIKGLLNRIDYAASGGIDVEKENNFLIEALEVNLLEKFRKLKKEAGENPSDVGWNELQKFMIDNRESNLVITAQTGMGKTEAGLLWIGNNKGFFTLPLKTAINAMYKRIVEDIIITDYDERVGLLHSDIRREYMNRAEKDGTIDFDQYYSQTKQLSLPLTVCTIDQIFGFVYRYRGFEPNLATLAYSKVVIDEVQMYSPDLLAYLVVGLSYINKLGGKFAILTATLPPLFVELLKEEGIGFKEKVFTNEKIRHSLKIQKEEINSDFIIEQFKNNKILVICNTVKAAQKIFNELIEVPNLGKEVNLFHSGFIKKDRKKKEEDILEFGHKENKRSGIWVTTQVVEASLDIDFDILITELSDLNGLFQRMGRCYRSRDWESLGFNCYVFDGGEKNTNGIGHIIDKDIFQLSKKLLENIEGELSEKRKIELINQLYTREVLKDTKYYEELLEAIDYVKLTSANEIDKATMKKIFRNIDSRSIIPKNIYDLEKSEIEKNIEIIKRKYHWDMIENEREVLKKEKLKARLYLEDLTIAVSSSRIRTSDISLIEISEYERLEVLNCDYNSLVGIEFLKNDKDSQIKHKDNSF